MMAPTRPLTGEQRRELDNFRQRRTRARRAGLFEEEFLEKERRLRERREKYRREESEKEQTTNRRAAMWVQMLRIQAYLPRLYEQRQEAAQRLGDLDRLIHDEEIEASRIRAAFD